MMMDLKHENGDPMFNAISVTLMCDACKKKGALECPHNQHEIPHWKRDKKRGKLVQSIMQTDKTMYLRENAGVVAKQENNAFSLDGVDLLSASTFTFRSAADLRAPLFTCIDTAGGGSSCTAVCTGIFTPSHSLVVSLALLYVYVERSHVRHKGRDVWIFTVEHTLALFVALPFVSTEHESV